MTRRHAPYIALIALTLAAFLGPIAKGAIACSRGQIDSEYCR